MKRPFHIFLSPPHLNGSELKEVERAFASNWVAPAGPALRAFEKAVATHVGIPHAVAVSSATAGLHLSLIACGIKPGDEVITSDFTFVASANPIRYVGAKPIFIDSEPTTWNLDPNLLESFLKERAKSNRIPKALLLVHLYGQSADMDAILSLCERYNLILIEDAAEALGALYKGKSPGTFGKAGVYSFNGNKIITTSGGGMVVSADQSIVDHVHHLATQAKAPGLSYHHEEIGYNYRLSNISAAIGVAQIASLEAKVAARRAIYDRYREKLSDLDGIAFTHEPSWSRSSRWLSCLLLPPHRRHQVDALCIHMQERGIESRPLWKPMHLQPLYLDAEHIGGSVCEDLWQRGLCLPSSSSLSPSQQDEVCAAIRDFWLKF